MSEGTYYLFIVVITMGLVARLFWWMGETYMGGRNICRAVHRNLPDWWDVGRKMIFYKPKDISVHGFFFALLWPCIICLNILFLAQVFELFVPGGKRMLLPWVGSYSTFPLIMGILYACAQASFGIVFKESSSRTAKVGYMCIIIISIVVEMGLASYRGWLLSVGEQMISPTVFDQIMIKGGPILAGFLGFIVPVSEVTMGTIGFREFFDPIIKAFFHWVGGVLSVIWIAVAWFLFGFHNKKPGFELSFVSRLNRDSGNMRGKVAELREQTKRLQNKANLLDGCPESFDKLEKRLNKLDTDTSTENKNWNEEVRKLGEKVRASQCDERDFEIIEHEIDQLRSRMNRRSWELENTAESYRKNTISEKCSAIKRYEEFAREAVDLFQTLSVNAQNINKDYDPLKEKCAEIVLVLGGKTPGLPTKMPESQIEELQEKATLAGGDNQFDRKCGRQSIAECEAVIKEIIEIGASLEGIEETLKTIKPKVPSLDSVPPPPTKGEERKLKKQALLIANNIFSDREKISRELKKLKRECRTRKYELVKKPWWWFSFCRRLI